MRTQRGASTDSLLDLATLLARAVLRLTHKARNSADSRVTDSRHSLELRGEIDPHAGGDEAA